MYLSGKKTVPVMIMITYFNLEAKEDREAVPGIHQKFTGCCERPGIESAEREKIVQPKVPAGSPV